MSAGLGHLNRYFGPHLPADYPGVASKPVPGEEIPVPTASEAELQASKAELQAREAALTGGSTKLSAEILAETGALEVVFEKIGSLESDRRERLLADAGDDALDDLDRDLAKLRTEHGRRSDRLAILREKNAAAIAQRSAVTDQIIRLRDAETAERKRAAASKLAAELHTSRLEEVIAAAVALDRLVGRFGADVLRLMGTSHSDGEWTKRIAEIITMARLAAHHRDRCLAPSANLPNFSSREAPSLFAAVAPTDLAGDDVLPVNAALAQWVRL
jgi:hypothetical protein